MPCTPRVFSASLTSSSLKGFRTATISFICVALPFVRSRRSVGRALLGPYSGPIGRSRPYAGELEGARRPATDTGGEALLGERLLVVNGEVADLEHVVLVAHATQDELQDPHDHEGGEGRPGDDPDGRPELL